MLTASILTGAILGALVTSVRWYGNANAPAGVYVSNALVPGLLWSAWFGMLAFTPLALVLYLGSPGFPKHMGSVPFPAPSTRRFDGAEGGRFSWAGTSGFRRRCRREIALYALEGTRPN